MKIENNAVLNQSGVEVTYITIAGDSVPGIAVEIPGTDKRVLQIKCPKGMLLCGLFSLEKIDGLTLRHVCSPRRIWAEYTLHSFPHMLVY